jgi:hypothetical protein
MVRYHHPPPNLKFRPARPVGPRWERREWLPVDLFRQNRSENGFVWLMGLNHCDPPHLDALRDRGRPNSNQLGIQLDRRVKHLRDWTVLLRVAGHSRKGRFHPGWVLAFRFELTAASVVSSVGV